MENCGGERPECKVVAPQLPEAVVNCGDSLAHATERWLRADTSCAHCEVVTARQQSWLQQSGLELN